MSNFRYAKYGPDGTSIDDPNAVVPIIKLSQSTQGQYDVTLPNGANGAPLLGKNAGTYLGAHFGKRTRRGFIGRKVASWGALQNQAGTVALVAPASVSNNSWLESPTTILKLTQNATASFGQQSPPDSGQSFLPRTVGSAFTFGIEVENPGTRSLNFEVRFYNVAANRNSFWNACVDAGKHVFLTFSSSQVAGAGLTMGTDTVNFIRVTQVDTGAEGAWLPGEYLLFGNVYIDVAARPRFLLTFDDGYRSQRYPITSFKVSGAATVSSTSANVLTFAAAHSLIVGEQLVFTESAPTSLTIGTVYYVQTVPDNTHATLATDAALTTTATTTGFAGTAKYQYGGNPGRSVQDMVENYGFRGSLFIVGSWIGTSGVNGYVSVGGNFLSASDLLAMSNEGWSIGSHSNTHPSNLEGAGLRLLGPYGFFLSNTFDNLPAQYKTNWGITSGNGRRRVTAGTQASPSVFTTENAHQFLPNQPIVFTDVAPTGCVVGVTYYVATTPSGTTFTLATDQGTLANRVNNSSAPFAGTCNYRWPGSANSDVAIYNDIVAGAQALMSIGIFTGLKFFALPQGAADSYVRSACIRAGLSWIRGISNSAATNSSSIPIGYPSGGGGFLVENVPGGWITQQDAVQTDGATSITQTLSYVDNVISQGACGCNYHHEFATANMATLDRLCQYLRTKSDAGVLDVQTLDEMARDLGF